MPRLPPRTEVLRALFARSGNRCAFPGCTAPLVNEKNQFIAQVCHIEAADSGGERFNPAQTDEQRRAYENLVLLCYPHHVETNDVVEYGVEKLRRMKHAHEQTFGRKLFQIDEALLHKIADEMQAYWKQVALLHRERELAAEFAIEIDASASYFQLAEDATQLIADLERLQGYLIESDRLRGLNQDPPTGPNDFEVLYLGFTNTITKLSVVQCQMEIKYLEEYMKLHPGDQAARVRLESLKPRFARLASSASYVD
jgi:hypothetical protein